MTERQKLERLPPQRPFGALLGSKKKLPLNQNGMLAQYDTFNEALSRPQPSPHKKWVPFSSLWDKAQGHITGLLAPCVYLVLYTVYDIIVTKSGGAGSEHSTYSPACAMLVVEASKMLFSFVAYLIFSAESWPTINKVAYYIAALALPAACYAGIAVVNISRLANTSLMQYGIWHQATIVFSILLWFIIFRRRCSVQQSIAFLFLFAGCSVNAMQPESVPTVEARALWVLACSALSAIGCVSNEYVYKNDMKADINLQNVVLYAMTSVCSILFIRNTCSERLTSASSFFEGFRGECWAIITIQVFSGLAVSRMLKHTSVITKCYTMAIGISFEVFLAHRFSHAHGFGASMPLAFGSFLVAFSTVLYFTTHVSEHPKAQTTGGGNDALAKFRKTPFKWQLAGGKAMSPDDRFKV
jgi:hypothetical protein